MERVQMCRVCLVEDAPMYVVVNRKMHEVYEKLSNKQFVTEDRRPVLVCYFCCSRLKQCCRFQRQCLEAEELFAQMLDEDYELNPSIKPDLGLNNGFIISPMELLSIVGECQTESHEVKEELPADCEGLADIIEPTEELQVDELEMDNPDFSDVEDIPVHHSESDVSVTEGEDEQDPNWAPVVKKTKLRIRRTNPEDLLIEEQKKSGQSDSKVIRITQNRTRKPRIGFKEPLIYIKRRPYKCDICQRSFTQKGHLKRHILIHTGEKPYKCDVCQNSFNVKSNLTCHIRKHTGEKRIRRTKPEDVLIEEQKKSGQSDSKVIRITQNRTRKPRIGFKEPLIYIKRRPYKCDICQRSFTQKGHLKRHILIHTGEKPYKCDVCQNSFNVKSNLTCHIRKHTGEKRIRRTKPEDVLIEEQKKSGQSDSKVIRITQNRTRKPRIGFKEHLIHIKRRPNKCDICQRSFTQTYHLKRHIRIHTGEKPYKCDVCQYSFNEKSNLKNHIRIHTGEKPYKCELCHYSCNQKSGLKRHLMVHTGEKPFKCEVCQRGFNQKISLLNHIPIHTGEKPYKCDLCQYSCIQKGVFTKHIRIHTEATPYALAVNR